MKIAHLFFLCALCFNAVNAQNIRCDDTCRNDASKCDSEACCGCDVCDSKCGADWTEETQLAVLAKLHWIWDKPSKSYKEIIEEDSEYCDSSCSDLFLPWSKKCLIAGCVGCAPCRGNLECFTGFPEDTGHSVACDGNNGAAGDVISGDDLPRPSMWVRLAFHDCIPYSDGSGGCDGCLKFTDMFRRYNDLASQDKRNMRRDDPVVTTHNGLGVAADITQEIWVNPSYPKGTIVLEKSLRDMGISRADLISFAGLAASQHSMNENNIYCRGENEQCAHLYEYIDQMGQCEITPKQFKFQSGRRDCADVDKPTADANNKVSTMQYEFGHRFRDYETTKEEVVANPSGNSDHLMSFFEDNFDLSESETVALMGAHSLGKLRGPVSLWKYQWQRSQDDLLNNNYYRMLLEKPSMYQNCKTWDNKGGRAAVGGPGGQLAKTGFYTRPIRKSKSAGPYMWFHYYERCPMCYIDDSGTLVNDDKRGDKAFKSLECCKCNTIQEGDAEYDEIVSKCVQSVTHDEIMIGVDMGVLYNFTVDEYGVPGGCNFPSNWNRDNIVDQIVNGNNHDINYYLTEPRCPVTGQSRKDLVELYAKDNNKWAEDYLNSFEKMMRNGYHGTNILKQQVSVLSGGPGKISCFNKKSKFQCEKRDTLPYVKCLSNCELLC